MHQCDDSVYAAIWREGYDAAKYRVSEIAQATENVNEFLEALNAWLREA